MAYVPYLGAVAISSSLRIVEKFLPIQENAERYIDGEINFQTATDDIVKHIRIYTSLTTTKVICDAIVLSITGRWIYNILMRIRGIFKGLFRCKLNAFIGGIKSSFDYIVFSLQSCSINVILDQFKRLIETQRTFISIMKFCVICNQIYFLIIALTSDWSKTIQLELVKYWLECMGIIRAVAEGLDIDFVKYMAQCYERNTVHIDQSVDVSSIEWERVKDQDFYRIIELSLEDILHENQREEKVIRRINKVGQTKPEIKEDIYTIIIEPGCPDGKEFRFVEAGDQDPVNIPADLVVRIQTKPHPLYERVGSDLIYKVAISLEDARNGTPLRVPLIDGEEREFNLYNTTNSTDKRIMIDHAGLPDPENGGIRGRLIVKWDIELPSDKVGVDPTELCESNQ